MYYNTIPGNLISFRGMYTQIIWEFKLVKTLNLTSLQLNQGGKP